MNVAEVAERRIEVGVERDGEERLLFRASRPRSARRGGRGAARSAFLLRSSSVLPCSTQRSIAAASASVRPPPSSSAASSVFRLDEDEQSAGLGVLDGPRHARPASSRPAARRRRPRPRRGGRRGRRSNRAAFPCRRRRSRAGRIPRRRRRRRTSSTTSTQAKGRDMSLFYGSALGPAHQSPGRRHAFVRGLECRRCRCQASRPGSRRRPSW